MWMTICRSPEFGYALTQGGPTASTSGLELDRFTGHHQLTFGEGWATNCTDPTSGEFVACESSASWTADLVTGAISGPVVVTIPSEDCGCSGPPLPESIGATRERALP
jgi:hypothetical protein